MRRCSPHSCRPTPGSRLLAEHVDRPEEKKGAATHELSPSLAGPELISSLVIGTSGVTTSGGEW